MSQARALSSDEVQHLRDELAAGRTPTVWFTASAVGVPEGRSGKVTALGEVDEGDFVQVRPASSRDELSFSAAEITLERPPRKRKDDAASGTSAKGTGSAKSTSAASSASAATSSARTTSGKAGAGKAGAGDSAASQQKAPAEPTGRSAGSAGKSSAAQNSGSAQKSGSSPQSGSAQSPGSGQKSQQTGPSGTSKRKPRSISGATVTLTADDNGQWSVEVNTGKKRTLRPRTVSASAVAHAAKALHEDVAAAVEPLLESAREQQRARVEELQRELADAQRTLDELAE